MRNLVLTIALLAVPALAQENVGAWQFKSIVDPMSDATRGIANTSLTNDIVMIVKCDSNGDNQLYFSFLSKKYLGGVSSNKLRTFAYRIDGTPVRNMSAFHDDRTASVISVKPDNDGGRFLKEVSGATKLTLQLSSFDYETTTAVIDVTGAKQAFAKVATSCKDNSMLAYLNS
ncbi:hypothetical protein ACU5AX_02915 [Sphingomonas sp. XXL09]|uniref:hypothetical protein n=1 Tax=Sphingomonas sp. XXL09 TaxID=3457787 RepID=UPI00406BC9EF